MKRFFQAVDPEIHEEVNEGLPLEGVFGKTEKMARAIAVGRAGLLTINPAPFYDLRLKSFTKCQRVTSATGKYLRQTAGHFPNTQDFLCLSY